MTTTETGDTNQLHPEEPALLSDRVISAGTFPAILKAKGTTFSITLYSAPPSKHSGVFLKNFLGDFSFTYML